MANHFIALVGKANSGKTFTLNLFIRQNNGYFLEKRTYAICSVRGKTVFVVTSSPQERGRSRFKEVLKKDLVFFERFANLHHITNFVVLMAFTKPRSLRLISQRIDGAKRFVQTQGYIYHQVIKEREPASRKKQSAKMAIKKIKQFI